MARAFLLLVLAASFTSAATAQTDAPRWRLAVEPEYSTHHLGDLSDLQTSIVTYLDRQGMPPETVDRFPGLAGGRVALSRRIYSSHGYAGLFAERHTTGSRLVYADVTGGALVDQRLSTLTLGLQYESRLLPLWEGRRFRVASTYTMAAYGARTALVHDETLWLRADSVTRRSHYTALQPGGAIRLGVRFEQGRHFVGLQAGGFINLPLGFHAREGNEPIFVRQLQYLELPSKQKAFSDDRGLRVGLSAGVTF